MSKKHQKRGIVVNEEKQRYESKIIQNTEENMEISKEYLDDINEKRGLVQDEINLTEKSTHKKNKRRYNAIKGYEKS